MLAVPRYPTIARTCPVLILISVCLLASPATCHEERLNFSFEQVSATSCMIRSQAAIAEWQQGHPGWQVKRWRCASPRSVPTAI
jgi:hypothetical protein